MRTKRHLSKKLVKAQECFRRAVMGFIESKGAIPNPDGFYDYILGTPIGELRITVYENWIACCFDNVKAALVFTTKHCFSGHECNPYSGKWNFHYPNDAELLSNNLLIRSFVGCVEKLLAFEPNLEAQLAVSGLDAVPLN